MSVEAASRLSGSDDEPADTTPGPTPADSPSGKPSDLPWWRRPRHLRRQLAGTLVLVALASIVLVAGLNFIAARQLLDQGARDQLAGVGEARARSIDLGIDRVLGSTSASAADLGVVQSLRDLSAGYADLAEENLSERQGTDLNEWYRSNVVDPLNELPLDQDFALGDVEPRTDAARYAQLHYTIGGTGESRRDLDDAADGSTYSTAHAQHHPYLRGLADVLGLEDLLLVNLDGAIVYSVEKRIDFGTNLVDGPYRDSRLAESRRSHLSRLPIGEAVLTDIELYLPAGAEPVTFAAATIRDDTEVIGVLVTQVPVSSLNAVTTASQGWEDVGLSTGESYVVGPDRVLSSESRLWIEDPDSYLEKVDDPELAQLIEALGSPVGLQRVDTEPVETALDGTVFEGTSRNYLGQKTFTYATPISVRGVEWIVVADIPLNEARAPLYDYGRTIGLVLVIILPIAGIIGLWLANRLTRPIPPVVAAALAVAEGERNPDLPDLGRDEFGDLARRLGQMATELGLQETALAEQYEERRQLLLTVLPPRMVQADGIVSGQGDNAATATVVAASIAPSDMDQTSPESELPQVLAEALTGAEQLAQQHGVERVRAAADQYLFLVGLDSPDGGADLAIAFAIDLLAMINELAADKEVSLPVHLGLSSGSIATGILERGSLTFAAWGEPVRRALALGALSQADEILVDDSTAEIADTDRWPLTAATDVVALDGQPMTLFTVAGDNMTPPSRAKKDE
ncbi:MAG: HAMP domain-containing protein [Actinomycetia bacterium]|nr:HAMP domain-containing protein [Actinomycetes bacterium]